MQGTLHKHNFTQRLEQSPSGSQYTTACKVGPHMGLNERLSELSNNSSFSARSKLRNQRRSTPSCVQTAKCSISRSLRSQYLK